jgi:co-chaperonin GroES (HSP10)
MVKPLGNRVLVEQVMIKKQSLIIKPGNAGEQASEFDIYFKVLALGESVPENSQLNVGDIPIFAKYVDLGTMKIIEKTEKGLMSHIIVHYDDIAGIDPVDDSNQAPVNARELIVGETLVAKKQGKEE